MSAPVGNTGYTAVIVTFRREATLTASLTALLAQTAGPSLVIVVDNDPEGSAYAVAANTTCPDSTHIEYLCSGENLGPAGGWARGVAWASLRDDRGEWLMVLDDDDPIGDPRVNGEILAVAASASEQIAGIGLRGANWRAATASLQRVHPSPGALTRCCYLASGGIPIYRWSAIDRHGFFDESLFFGFEDLEYGLRLRAAGLSVAATVVDAPHTVPSTNPTRTVWREYFKTRSLVTVCRRHLGRWALTVTTLRSVVIGAVVLALRERDGELAIARWRGWYDAMRGRLGRHRYVPTHNPAKAP